MRWTMALSLLALPASAAAQDSVLSVPAEEDEQPIILYHPRIDTIVVTAGGNLTPSPSDRVQSVTTITDIAQGLGERVENRLRDEAGLAQFRRSDGRSAHPTSQGVTLRGLGGNASSRALVLLDGVPQADPFGGWVAWSAFDSVPLTGARITRGGGSGADGPGALGGTISLSSDMADGGNAALSGGSRGSSDLVGGLGGYLEDGTVAVDGRWSRGDGFIPIRAADRGSVDRAAPYDQAGLGLRARFDAGENRRIEVAVRGWRDRRERGTDFSRSAVDGLDASIRYILDPTPDDGWQVSLLGYAQLREFDTGFASVAADRNSAAPALIQRVPALGLGARLEVRPSFGWSNPLRFGIDWRRVEGETQEQFFFTGTAPGRFRVAGGESTTVGAFADGYALAGDVRFTLSGRIDHWRIAPGFRIERNIGGSIRSDDRFAARSGWAGTGRAGVAYERGEVKLRAAGYTGWRLPTLNELYRPFRVGADATAANELLRPERLWGGEAGIDWSDSYGFSASVTAYWNRLENAIANVTLGRGPGNFPGVGFVAAGGNYAQRQNLDAIIAKGVEVQAAANIGPVDLRATYAFTDATVRADGAAAALDGRRPAQVARHAASFSAVVDLGSVKLDLRLRHTGAQNEDDLGTQRLGAATTVDAAASYAIAEDIKLMLRAENLFDALVPAAFGAGGAIERAAPRSVWVGVSAAF
ncbi:MAG: TonB-dependent receptor [Sphingopyxis sp.]|nr:TonB-dependent receptor [Sphingopyxis sp.]